MTVTLVENKTQEVKYFFTKIVVLMILNFFGNIFTYVRVYNILRNIIYYLNTIHRMQIFS